MQTKDEADKEAERDTDIRERQTHTSSQVLNAQRTVSITGPSVEFWKKFFVDYFNEQLLEKGI